MSKNQAWTAYLPTFVRKRVEGRQSLQKIINNAAWLSIDKFLRMGVGLVVSIWVVRYLGPDRFGQLSYATAFVALFGAIATLGLDGIVVRELVRKPDDANEILGSAFYLRAVGGITTFVVSLVAIFLLRRNDPLSWSWWR